MRRGFLPGIRSHSPLFPVFHVQRLRQFSGRIVLDRQRSRRVSLYPRPGHRLRRISSQCLCRFPSRFRFPVPGSTAADSVMNKRSAYPRYSYRLSYRGGRRYDIGSTGRCSDRRKSSVTSPDPVCRLQSHCHAITHFFPASHRPVSPDPAPEYHAQYPAELKHALHGPYWKTQAGRERQMNRLRGCVFTVFRLLGGKANRTLFSGI